MQRLVLICRHAESNDSYPLEPDFERELTKNGVHQAHLTGKWLRENYRKVDVILSSPAKRARATAAILAGRLYFDEEAITYDPFLYNAREAQLINSLSNLPDEKQSVLLVAHNPGITKLCRLLTDKHIAYLEPADVMVVSLDLAKWQEILYKTGEVEKQLMQST